MGYTLATKREIYPRIIMANKERRQKIKRTVVSRLKKQRLDDPNIFLTPKRIDIAAKTIFARAYLEKNSSTWPEYVYKEHIRAFNNFYEKSPVKMDFNDFKSSFVETIDSVKHDDNWKHIAPVFRTGSYLVNGAHRVAASIVLNDKVNTIIPDEIYQDNYNYDFFKRSKKGIPGIDEDVLDSMTIEYVSLKKKNIFVAVVFPAAEGLRDEAYRHLSQLGEIVNMKTFKHDEFIGKEVIKQLYFNSKNDEWNYGLDFDSANYKAALCFDGVGDLQVYVIEANLEESSRIKEKQYLRSLWKKDKHSIHITDSMDEANRVVRMFFNENSRKILKLNREYEFSSKKIHDLFYSYIELLPDNILERENIAIEGSAVLDLLNIRNGNDIDYITRDESINIVSSDIEKHGLEENKYHSYGLDEILTNPKHFFYYKGYKFIDPTTLLNYKKNRIKATDDPKDRHDIELIANFLDSQGYARGFGTEALVSVIIPVYNTPIEYLRESLEDIRNQSHKHLEIIIIDDGSNPEIGNYIAEYIAKITGKDKRWKLHRQDNKGLAGARNAGYRIATGKYIQFLDSDDRFDEHLIATAVKKAEASGADVVIENFKIKDIPTGREGVALHSHTLPTKDTFTLMDLPKSRLDTIPYNVWSKLFRKSFLDEHKITHDEELLRAEDVLFSCSALVQARKLVFVAHPLVTYLENIPTSNTQTNDTYPAISITSWSKLRDYLILNKLYDTYRSDYELAMMGSLQWHYEKMNSKEGRVKLSKAAVNFFREIDVLELHDFRITATLTVENPGMLTFFKDEREQIRRLNKLITAAQSEITALESKLAHLEQPGVKLASRKLAGAAKRKVRRKLSS